ncbi:MAG: response regulator [Bdellovibrio sp.]
MIHILIVDDEADTHLLYKLKLKKIFHNVAELNITSFLNAADCLSYLHRNDIPPVDLLLSDINMPQMDGFEFLAEVNILNVPFPIYMISAYESPDFRKRADDMGALRFLSKPVDFRSLGELMKQDVVALNK